MPGLAVKGGIMNQFDELERFADLVRAWNAVNRALSRILGRSASSGYITEDIASRILPNSVGDPR